MLLRLSALVFVRQAGAKLARMTDAGRGNADERCSSSLLTLLREAAASVGYRIDRGHGKSASKAGYQPCFPFALLAEPI